MSGKIVNDIFDVFMLLTLFALLALEWIEFPVDEWARIGCAVAIAIIGSTAASVVRRKLRSR